MSFNPIVYSQLMRLKKSNPLIKKPEITAPEVQSTGVSASVTITCSSYAPLYSGISRDKRKFQIIKSGGSFALPDWDAEADADDYTPDPTLDVDDVFRVRVKDVDVDGNESEWSEFREFATADTYIEQPSLSIEKVNNKATLLPELAGSDFTIINGSDSHDSTDWRIKRDADDAVVWESLGDTSNLTSIQVESESGFDRLGRDTYYKFEVRYHGTTHTSSWESVTMLSTDAYIEDPSLSVEGESSSVPETPTLTGSDFSVYPSEITDTHIQTDWEVRRVDDDSLVWSETSTN